MKWLTLLAVLCLVGCGAGSTSSVPTQPTPTPSPTVTSVTVAPQTATVAAGSSKQFAATVTGTNAFNSAVTWSVVGLGTVDQTGLFTASGTPGPATVTATSVETPSMQGSGQITVTAAPVALLGWYGTLVPSNGSTPLPLDFDLTQTGSALASGPVLIIAETDADIQYCTNFYLPSGLAYGSVLKPQPNDPLPQMTGTINGQNVTLSYAPYAEGAQPTVTMTGTLGTDAAGSSTITGTYSTPASECFPTNSGTFTFTQYQAFAGTYVGSFTYGVVGQGTPPVTANNVQLTVSNNSLSYSAIPPPWNYPASPVYSMMSERAGRFFHVWTSFAGAEQGSTNLVVWGVVAGPDQQGNQLNAYVSTTNVGMSQLFDPLSPPLSGTMTRQ